MCPFNLGGIDIDVTIVSPSKITSRHYVTYQFQIHNTGNLETLFIREQRVRADTYTRLKNGDTQISRT